VKRTLAIGDIHGCYEKLVKLLSNIDYNPGEDLLIFVGDYIDRGTESYLTIQLIKECVSKGAIALLGNHELMAINALEDDYYKSLWLYNGGQKTLDSYSYHKKYVKDDLEFFKSLPYCFENEKYIFVHAGLNPSELEERRKEDLVWIRDEWLNCNYNGKPCVFGHTPMKDIFISENGKQIGIDTGAFYYGKLSCIELPSMKIYQVK